MLIKMDAPVIVDKKSEKTKWIAIAFSSAKLPFPTFFLTSFPQVLHNRTGSYHLILPPLKLSNLQKTTLSLVTINNLKVIKKQNPLIIYVALLMDLVFSYLVYQQIKLPTCISITKVHYMGLQWHSNFIRKSAFVFLKINIAMSRGKYRFLLCFEMLQNINRNWIFSCNGRPTFCC